MKENVLPNVVPFDSMDSFDVFLKREVEYFNRINYSES